MILCTRVRAVLVINKLAVDSVWLLILRSKLKRSSWLAAGSVIQFQCLVGDLNCAYGLLLRIEVFADSRYPPPPPSDFFLYDGAIEALLLFEISISL